MAKRTTEPKSKPEAEPDDPYECVTRLSSMMTTIEAIRVSDKVKPFEDQTWATLRYLVASTVRAIEHHSPKVDCSILYALSNLIEDISSEIECANNHRATKDTIRKISELGCSRLRGLQGSLDILVGNLREAKREWTNATESADQPEGRPGKPSPSKQAKRERFRESCEKCQQLLADSRIREYWVAQAGSAMKRESAWQGVTLDYKRKNGHNPWAGRGLRYEWPRDKDLIYALMLVSLDIWSSVRILPPRLRETEFYRLNTAIVPDLMDLGLTVEYQAYIEADLKGEGLLGQEAGRERPPRTKAAGAKRNKQGRPQKHLVDKLRAAGILFDELQGEGKSVNECWLEVHKKLGFISPEAAKQAVYRFKQQNKIQN